VRITFLTIANYFACHLFFLLLKVVTFFSCHAFFLCISPFLNIVSYFYHYIFQFVNPTYYCCTATLRGNENLVIVHYMYSVHVQVYITCTAYMYKCTLHVQRTCTSDWSIYSLSAAHYLLLVQSLKYCDIYYYISGMIIQWSLTLSYSFCLLIYRFWILLVREVFVESWTKVTSCCCTSNMRYGNTWMYNGNCSMVIHWCIMVIV